MSANHNTELTGRGSLAQWLDYLENLHPVAIDMGLTRVQQVFDNLNLIFSHTRIVTVAGTNGKGTTCAALEQILIAHEYSVAVYSSPHINRFNERLRLNNQEADDQLFCDAFAQIELVRGNISLSYFEYSTLAAMIIAAKVAPDVLLLEVGLGGRLDAVNVLAADLAVITTIDLDHQDYLGDTRELIGAEKAGIFRDNISAVIGEPDVPKSVIKLIQEQRVNAQIQGQDFHYSTDQNDHFIWQGRDGNHRYTLPSPNIPAQNASTALASLHALGITLNPDLLTSVFSSLTVTGRCQWINSSNPLLIDVAHNPQAAKFLANKIAAMSFTRLHLVVAMLHDKDIAGTLEPMLGFNPTWYCAPLNMPRGASAEDISATLKDTSCVNHFGSVIDACDAALQNITKSKNDLVVVFGSFYTIADVLAHYQQG